MRDVAYTTRIMREEDHAGHIHPGYEGGGPCWAYTTRVDGKRTMLGIHHPGMLGGILLGIHHPGMLGRRLPGVPPAIPWWPYYPGVHSLGYTSLGTPRSAPLIMNEQAGYTPCCSAG